MHPKGREGHFGVARAAKQLLPPDTRTGFLHEQKADFFVKFEVPQRQQLASERTSLSLFAPAPSSISFVPLTRNLSLADPSPYPGVDRPLRGNCRFSVLRKAREGAAACPGPLKMHRVPQEPVFCTARIFRTTGGPFRYRMPLLYQKSLFCAQGVPENASRTTGGCSTHRTHIPYHRRPSPVPNEPNATNGRGKKPLPQTEPSANSSQMPGKRSLPQTALPVIQQTPEKRGLFPRQHHRQIPHNRNPVAAGKYLFRRRCSHAWI